MSNHSTPEKEPTQHQPIDLSPGIKMANEEYETVGYQDLEYSSDSEFDEQADSVTNPLYTQASSNLQGLAITRISSFLTRSIIGSSSLSSPSSASSPSSPSPPSPHRSAFATVASRFSGVPVSPPPPISPRQPRGPSLEQTTSKQVK